MAEIVVREANGAAELESVRELMRAYQRYLAENPTGAAGICLTGYDSELAALPGAYGPPGGTLLLAWVNGAAAGVVAFRPARKVTHERACEMKRLWVGDGFRGLGLGKRLVEAGLDWAVNAGYVAMYLDTVPAAMPQANRLYEEMGFERVERYNDNDVSDVVFFRRRLTVTID